MSFNWRRLLPGALLACAFSAGAQTIPCRNTILLTRQDTTTGVTRTFIGSVSFQTTGSVNIQNYDTVFSKKLNGSVYYNGYLWAHDWTGSAASGNFQLLKIDSTTTTSITPSPTLALSGTFNNAGVDAAGVMYLMNGLTLYRFDLTTTTPTYLGTKTCTMSPIEMASGHNWGDLAVDPVSGKMYAWYHPTSGTALPGLYTLDSLTNTSPRFQKVGSQTTGQQYTVGSLFFTDDGQLMGYGATTLGGIHDRLYAIDKATGQLTQYGGTSLPVSQSDGCSCAFRVSLDKSPSIPAVNLQRCGADTFQYTMRTRNYTGTTVSSITFRDTLDSRFYIATSATALQTTLQGIYGGSVSVSIASYGGGANNLITATGLSLSTGTASFSLPVGLNADNFTGATVISQQACLDGLSVNLGGPKEYSDNPLTYEPGDKTPITINISGSRCVPPVADNYTALPFMQGWGATSIPPPVGSDADGTIASYTIVTLPTSYGTLSYCPNAPSACTAGQYVNITSANTSLTTDQVTTLRFDPSGTASGTGSFTFTVTDNSGTVSSAATYRLPVKGAPPVANNIMENSMLNTNAATAIAALSGADADEPTLQNFKILTLPGGSAGTLQLCNPGCTNITANQLIATSDIGNLRFDPLATFTGNASFTYTDIDNSGNVGNTATYTIPVVGTASVQRPPLANNVTSQTLNNSLASTAIPPLRASDLDGWVTGYTIFTVPASGGTLYLCNPSCAAVTANQSIAVADIDKLQFDPLATFTGTATFTFKATDNSSLLSNVATYNIPVINNPPTAANLAYTVPYNVSNTPLPSILGSDKDGTIASYTVTSLPASGTLSLCNPGCVAVTTNQTIATTDVANLAYTPATNSTGTYSFTYTSTDNNSNVSTAATYLLFVNNLAPIAADIINDSMANTRGATSLLSLSATDADGTIAGYTIRSLPPASSGILSLSGTALAVGDAVLPAQLSLLQFDPTANYTGITSFTYTASDNSGNISNVATLQIPITGVGNLPPVAKSIQVNPIAVSAGTTAITALSGTDPDAVTKSIATFVISTVPDATRGVVKYCPLAPSACTSGQMTGISATLSMTISQSATLQFTPNSGYIGPFTFSYTTIDSSGLTSNLALYNIPVTGLAPRVPPIISSSMANTVSATAIPTLTGTDPDGSIAAYVIETIPAATEGVLYLCTPSCAAITAAQEITAANAANLKFDPAAGFAGDVVFNYHALDNHRLRSNAAKYTIPVDAQPPLSKDVTSPKLRNSLGSTSIPALLATGGSTVAGYTVASLPPSTQGVLYLCTPSCAAVTAGQYITIANAGSLQFDPASGYTGDAIFNYYATDGAGNTSNLATYSIPMGTPVALPISGLDLTASLSNVNHALLQWHSDNETGVSHFELERSVDAASFERIAAITASGKESYSRNDDLSTFGGNVYYRVRQVEANGAVQYSKVASVSLTKHVGDVVLTASPNPFGGTLTGSVYAAQSGMATLVLRDVSGRMIVRENVILHEGANAYGLPAQGIAPGMYQLNLYRQGVATQTIKVMRQ